MKTMRAGEREETILVDECRSTRATLRMAPRKQSFPLLVLLVTKPSPTRVEHRQQQHLKASFMLSPCTNPLKPVVVIAQRVHERRGFLARDQCYSRINNLGPACKGWKNCDQHQ